MYIFAPKRPIKFVVFFARPAEKPFFIAAAAIALKLDVAFQDGNGFAFSVAAAVVFPLAPILKARHKKMVSVVFAVAVARYIQFLVVASSDVPERAASLGFSAKFKVLV